jgi:haloacetate dehalogenase
MGSQNYADWHGVVHDPAVTTAMLEDYRAGLGPDRAADETDRANGRQVACPTLLLRSARDDIQELYGDVLAVWRPWARAITGRPIDGGHHIAEEAPDALADAIAAFLRPARGSSAGRAQPRCEVRRTARPRPAAFPIAVRNA